MRELLPAHALKNWYKGDPVLDWFDLYGEENGFVPDTQDPNYVPELDMGVFVREKTREFRKRVVEHLRTVLGVKEICNPEVEDIEAKCEQTLEAMRSGAECILGGTLVSQKYGVTSSPSLLVRSDCFARFLQESPDCSCEGDLTLGHDYFYIPVDISFSGYELKKDGGLKSKPHKHFLPIAHLVGLAEMQGVMPSFGYLLGRYVKPFVSTGKNAPPPPDEEPNCFLRLAGVKADEKELARFEEALAWARKVREEGRNWNPRDSELPEMQLDMGSKNNSPWRNAIKALAEEVRPLSAVWKIGVSKVRNGLPGGVRSWHPRLDVGVFFEKDPDSSVVATIRRILEAQEDGFVHTPPEKVAERGFDWYPEALEFYVDFETLNHMNDDFSKFPVRGGYERIFMVGCGHLENNEWKFRCFVMEEDSDEAERAMLTEWLEYMESVKQRLAPEIEQARVIHWADAENSTLFGSARSAAKRLNLALELNLVDVLEDVRSVPFVVNGALAFGIKHIAKALYKHGKIATKWEDGVSDGLSAQIGIWRALDEAKAKGIPVMEARFMQEIVQYNEVDCRAMMEILKVMRGLPVPGLN